MALPFRRRPAKSNTSRWPPEKGGRHLTPSSVIVRAAVRSDMPGLWEVRYAVTENTLTPGRISDEELRRSIEEDGRGWVAE